MRSQRPSRIDVAASGTCRRSPSITPKNSSATATVLHNGVLVHDHQELMGTTGKARSGYQKHADKLPLLLQEHGNPVRYRNVWVVPGKAT